MKSMVLSCAALGALALFAQKQEASEYALAPEAPFEMKAIGVWQAPDREFSIEEFGAKRGGEEKCTAAFAAAIESCARSGGGRVVVPAGDWLSGAIHLKSNVALELKEGAKIIFSDEPSDYLPAVPTSWEGVEVLNYSPLLYAYGATNVAIIGKGTLAPKMDNWRKWFSRPPEHMAFTAKLYDWCSEVAPIEERDALKMPGSNARPHLIQFNRCTNILLDGFSIRSSPFWTIHLYHSENVVARNLDVYAHGHNNDGIDVEMTKNVIIEDCKFDQGDDAVVIKAGRNQDAWALSRPSENIVIRNCEIVDGHVLLGIGSEMSGGVRNVYMHDCKMTGNALNIFYMKTNERRGGFIENIYIKDCEVEAIGKKLPMSVVGIETDVMYQWRNLPTKEVKVTRIRNIVAENLKANRAKHLVMIYGDARDEIDGVKIDNVICDKIEDEKIIVSHAKNVTIDGEEIAAKNIPAPKR
ncbi:MAG: glycoside hydrolase family 28 protein [Kiritimatiellae bacterium]|nr:glycoside hydrolase family 28 protein [Kiritimatiellia bacterium]